MPNSYGEHDYNDENRVHALNGIIIRMLKLLKTEDRKFVVWGSGKPIREWGYMPDIARFFKHIIDENIDELPNPINIGQGVGHSINEIVNLIKEKIDPEIEIINDVNKIDGDPVKILDGSKFREQFPNFEFTDIETGVENTINYYKRLKI